MNFFARGVAKIKKNSRELSNSGNSDILARSDACFNPREDRGNSLKTRLREVFKVTLICFSPFKILNLSYEIFFFFFFFFFLDSWIIQDISANAVHETDQEYFCPELIMMSRRFLLSLSLSLFLYFRFFLLGQTINISRSRNRINDVPLRCIRVLPL